MSVGIKTHQLNAHMLCFNIGKNQSKSSTTNGEITAQKSRNALLKQLCNNFFRKLTFFLTVMIQTRYNQVLEPSKSECS